MKIFRKALFLLFTAVILFSSPIMTAEAAKGDCTVVMVTEAGNYVKTFTGAEVSESLSENPAALTEWMNFLEVTLNGTRSKPVIKPEGIASKANIIALNKELLSQDIKVSMQSGTRKIIFAINPYLLYTEDLTDPSDYSAINFKIASFSTKYKPNIDREINVALSASRINGTIVQPGELFSASNSFGPRTSANGYVKAAVYMDGEVVDGIGGGICQVSSTIFNTTLLAGIIPTQRYNHSMHVSYLSPGLDATIVSGQKDFQFVNPYAYPIYIEALARQGVLTISFYSNAAALGGFSYMPSTEGAPKNINTYLNKYFDGAVLEKIYIGNSRYK